MSKRTFWLFAFSDPVSVRELDCSAVLYVEFAFVVYEKSAESGRRSRFDHLIG